MAAPQADDDIRRNLAIANRILANEGVVDAFGHVSQRSADREDRFFISTSKPPATVMPSDIIELDFNGDPVDPAAPPSYLERFIHAEIYRARPDVQAIVHSHSPSVLPFSVVKDAPLRCLCHMTGFLGEGVPIFEIRDYEGERSDLLVRSSKLGAALAECLGDETVILMRGHGSTAVGHSLPQAVYHAVYAEVNARIQLQAMQLGPVTYLSAGEAELATSTAVPVGRSWDLWVSQVDLGG